MEIGAIHSGEDSKAEKLKKMYEQAASQNAGAYSAHNVPNSIWTVQDTKSA